MDREALIERGIARLKLMFGGFRHNMPQGMLKEDVLGEALIGIIEAAGSYNDEMGASWETYVSRRIKTIIIRTFQREYKHLHYGDLVDVSDGGGCAARIESSICLDDLHIEDLSTEDKLYIELFYVRDLTLKEIGDYLGMSRGGVMKAVQRALARIRKGMNGNGQHI